MPIIKGDIMVSFSRTVKEEIVFNDFDTCCGKSILSALIKINGTLALSHLGISLDIRTENAKIASKIHKLLKEIYQPNIEFKVQKKMRLKKNNVYVVRVNKAREILDDLGLYAGFGLTDVPQGEITSKECCKRAFLAGAFLAAGSVNHPSTANYHLEIAITNEELASFIQYLMNYFQLNAKVIKRRQKFIVYLKSAEKIGDFLGLVGASSSYLSYESIRIDRDFINSLNRLDNCEIANEMKTMNAANQQIEDIETIQEHLGLEFLDEKTQAIAKVRLANPEASLNELAVLYEEETGQKISKSGLHHRFKKMKEEASRLRTMEK